tara:strand:+ start:662 stop:1090 length:429 start_codon:yes stop_codon:yes gene_type:complete
MIKITSVKKNEYFSLMKIEESIFEKHVFTDKLKTYFNEGPIKIWKISTTKIIGFVIFYHIQDEVEIIQIGIIKPYQRKNYGTLIINKIKKLNIKKIFLEVSVKNSKAINFYLKNGFKKIGIREGYYEGSKYKIDALRLLFEF